MLRNQTVYKDNACGTLHGPPSTLSLP